MKYKKLRAVKDLSRGTSRSAGIDFFTPEFSDGYLFDVAVINKQSLEYDQLYIDRHQKCIVVAPGASIIMPSGIAVNMMTVDGVLLDETRGVAFIAHNRSGVATKLHLDVAADVADEDYQGELHLSLTNTSNRLVKIHENMKILQFLQTPIYMSDPVEIHNELFSHTTDRGENNFGHTDDHDRPKR